MDRKLPKEDEIEITEKDVKEVLSSGYKIPKEEIEMLKANGARDISELDMDAIRKELQNHIQITDVIRDGELKKDPVEVIKNHIKFLESISEGKSYDDILKTMTDDHLISILKIAKIDTNEIDLEEVKEKIFVK